ncbi:HAMP domain-containing sensor histidine kinase [Bacillus sp. FJAT-47783]|uniref:sensor histidine kinase n=1 Tax=Bacillus sp. FJAT-47783 TaxID=2922712 RepID=UPI001FAE32C0|nr:HAMP domain-containing sensor histidine kinase [Bacillus sp. FJAT-47783]
MDFIYINQNVLNNLFYVVVSIFFLYFLLDYVQYFQKSKRHQQFLMVVCLSVPLFLCMRFPIYIAPDCIHDFRQIPFLIGTLYGGWVVGFPLLLILLIVRFILYGFNIVTIVVYVAMYIVTALYSTKFIQLNRTKKLVMSTLLTFFLAILSTIIAIIIADFKVTQSYVVDFIIIPPIALLFVVYLIETLKDAIFMRSKLVKVEKMEVVSQLAASMSHEVRNPLTVVKGFMQLLKAPDLTHELKNQYISIAVQELDRASSIIDDYLTFAKPAPQKIEKIPVDQELKKVIDMIRPIANMNSVQLSKELAAGFVIGCPHHFHQCFLNFLKNSIEAMPNGGELRITSAVSKNKVTIKIKDTGVGMTEEQVSRFGEPYFSTKEKGTGLGTMVALKIIHAMNGTLKVESVPQKGTTITVTLPLHDESRKCMR